MSASPDYNIGLRLNGVIGIDVDNYRKGGIDKHGWRTLQLAEARWGELPTTWRSTARAATGASGIYFFRVPEGYLGLVSQLKLPDENGEIWSDIEICQFHHRYAVVWPSLHPETDTQYVWYDPAGNRVIGVIPRVDELPVLPEAWFRGLLELGRQEDPTLARDPVAVTPQLAPADDWDELVAQHHAEGVTALHGGPGSRHDNVGFVLGNLARDEERGRAGATSAIEALRDAFVIVLGAERDAETEYDRMVDFSRNQAASTESTQERTKRLVARVFANISHPTVGVGGRDVESVDGSLAPSTKALSTANLPDDFWAARPLLTHIRQAAWTRILSPDAVLGAVMARMAAVTPPAFRLPPIVGAPASMNWYVALCGPPSSGKSAAISTAARLMPIADRPRVVERPLGSGEGLVELYLGFEAEQQNGKTVQVRKQMKDGAFVTLDEGAALAEMAERKGSTLLAFMRSMWNGGRVGTTNASAETTRYLPEGAYSLGVVVGFQPALAAALLADDAAGTPQRFIWTSSTDPGIPDDADWPGELRLPLLQLGREARLNSNLAVAAPIVTEVRQAALARGRGQVVTESLDAHQDLLRLKAAGLLAMLDGRLEITVEDWQLGGVLVHTSVAVRAQVVDAVGWEARERAREALRFHTSKAKATVLATHEVEDDRAQKLLESAARSVARRARRVEGPMDRRTAMQAIRGAYRKAGVTVDDTLAHALDVGWLIETEDGYRPGSVEP
jgi:hypothetical protein